SCVSRSDRASLDREVRLPKFFRIHQVRGWAFVYDPAFLKNVRIVCYFECLGCVLLDDEHRETLFPEFDQFLEYLCSKFRGDPQGRLVQNDYLGLGHQCSSDAYHLLLSPAQPANAELGSFSEPGKESVHKIQGLVRYSSRTPRIRAQPQIVFRREPGKQPSTF